MYSTDWSGKYPSDDNGGLALLTPNYLKTIPECPAAGEVTYRARFNGPNPNNPAEFQDFYVVWCHGRVHRAVEVADGFPRYDGIKGLTKRPGVADHH